MNPLKKVWFDENSTPPKNMIWYRGEGKFYEWKNNDWVLCYNLVDVATQEQMEQNNYVIAQALNELNNRLEAVERRPIPKTTHVLTVLNTLNATDDVNSFLESLLLDGETPTMEQLENIDMDTIVKYGDKNLTISLKEVVGQGLFYINCTFYDYSGGLCNGLQLGSTITSGDYYITTLG